MDATIQSLETRIQRLEEQLVQCHDERMMFMRAYQLVWDRLPSPPVVPPASPPVMMEAESSVSVAFTIGDDGNLTIGETTSSGVTHAPATVE